MDLTQLTQIAKSVSEAGMGVVALCALLYAGWKLMKWLEEVKSNHLPHIQAALDKQNEHLAEHGTKLDTIIEQTRK